MRRHFDEWDVLRRRQMNKSTVSAKPGSVPARWYVVDARGMRLGRMASEIAKRLRGKHKPQFTPHVDTGDFIVVINARDVEVTGKKETHKVYYSHSGFPGGLKAITFDKLMERSPERIIQSAVKGMLPKNALGRKLLGKLKIYSGEEHPHAAQEPELLRFESL